MSRTHHVRPRAARSNPTISAKKPDEGRRWARRYRNEHEPARVRRVDLPIDFVLGWVRREDDT